jgi:ABC-2 type transport system permease protein
VWPLIKNNIQVLLAKKGTLFLLIIMPVILFSLGLLNNSASNMRLNIAVMDQDKSALSQSLTAFMAKDGSRVNPIAQEEIETKLLDGKEEAVVIIPPGFEADFLKGKAPEITIRSLKGQEITSSLKAGIDMYLSALDSLSKINAPKDGQALVSAMEEAQSQGLQLETRRITSGEVSQALNFASGMLYYILAMSMLQATSLILSEKHWNTLSRVRQAPVGKFTYLIANFLTAVIFLLSNLLALFILTKTLMPVHTTLPMYLLWFYFGLIWIFFGIFLALVVTSRAVYASVIPIITTVFAMLGGSFWPLWLMPPFMQKLAMITPHYWAIDAMTVIQKGQSLLTQRTDLLALTGFLALFLALGVFTLRRSRSVESFV